MKAVKAAVVAELSRFLERTLLLCERARETTSSKGVQPLRFPKEERTNDVASIREGAKSKASKGARLSPSTHSAQSSHIPKGHYVSLPSPV